MTMLVKLVASSSGFHTQGLLSEKGHQPSLLCVLSKAEGVGQQGTSDL